jgi:hypothetical protein
MSYQEKGYFWCIAVVLNSLDSSVLSWLHACIGCILEWVAVWETGIQRSCLQDTPGCEGQKQMVILF